MVMMMVGVVLVLGMMGRGRGNRRHVQYFKNQLVIVDSGHIVVSPYGDYLGQHEESGWKIYGGDLR